jgi:hypothetical protein
MGVEPEQFLQSDGNRRALLGLVIDREHGAGRRLEMRRRLTLEPRAQFPGQQRHQCIRKVAGGKLLQRSLAVERRHQPSLALRHERIVGQIGPRTL